MVDSKSDVLGVAVDGGALDHRRAQVSHANAQRSWNEREGVILTLRAGGLVGLGEASPLPGYSRDALPACIHELDGCWGRLPPVDPDADIRATFRAAVSASGVRAPAAVFALETALLDLVSRMRGQPAWAVLRGNADAKPIPLSALAEGKTPGDLAASAERALVRGIRVVKVKVGAAGGVAGEVERLAAVRARLGAEIGLRLDANQALSPSELPAYLSALAELGPELLEEPVAPSELARLEVSPIGLALDESLMADGARQLILDVARRGLHRAVVLKPMALGGLDRCLVLAEAAASVGLALVVTHMFDGPVASAGAACLALALPGTVMPCGLDAHGRHGRLESRVEAIGETQVLPFGDSGLGVARNG